MKKIVKAVLWIIAIAAAIACAAYVIIRYEKQITEFLGKIKDKFTSGKRKFTNEEYEDFADI